MSWPGSQFKLVTDTAWSRQDLARALPDVDAALLDALLESLAKQHQLLTIKTRRTARRCDKTGELVPQPSTSTGTSRPTIAVQEWLIEQENPHRRREPGAMVERLNAAVAEVLNPLLVQGMERPHPACCRCHRRSRYGKAGIKESGSIFRFSN